MGALDKLSEAMKLSEEKMDSLQRAMKIMMSQCQQLSEEQKQGLHNAMGLVMLHCPELEVQQNHTVSCFSDCYKDLQGKEENLKSVADSMERSIESFDDRRSSLAEGLKKMEEKERQLNGLLSKVNEELKNVGRNKRDISAASTCMDVWEDELTLRENEIEDKVREMTLKEDELRLREREVERKEDDLNRKKEELYDKDCPLYSKKKKKFQKWEDDLDAREMILDSREIDIFLADKEMKQKARDWGNELLRFSEFPDAPVIKRSRVTSEIEANLQVDSMVLFKGSAD